MKRSKNVFSNVSRTKMFPYQQGIVLFQIGQPENFDTSSDYFDLIVKTVKLFGADKLKIENDVKQIVDIEKSLFNVSKFFFAAIENYM